MFWQCRELAGSAWPQFIAVWQVCSCQAGLLLIMTCRSGWLQIEDGPLKGQRAISSALGRYEIDTENPARQTVRTGAELPTKYQLRAWVLNACCC